MCGRFSLSIKMDDLRAYFDLAGPLPPLDPRYNIAPSQEVAAIRLEEGGRRLALLSWGLIPFWADNEKIAYKLINARAETAHRLPAFRDAFKKRRCLIPAGGFFEWEKSGKEKRPFHIVRRDGRPLALAGLWERWEEEGKGRVVESCTILTTGANELLRRLHDRMPVLLDPPDFEQWLDPESDPAALRSLLQPAPEGGLKMVPVSSVVNSPKNEDPECIKPTGEAV